MKKIRIFIVGVVAFLGWYAGASIHADFSGFVEQLRGMNVPINSILSQTGINRYDIARLLNAVECKDCTVPGDAYLQRYTPTFWQNFSSQPGRDFDDIAHGQAFLGDTSYFYCVAYAGDKSYMRGYPETSPVCPGEFCGTRFTTKAEFLQVVMNLLAKYIYPVYSANWKTIDTWVNRLFFWEYAYRTLNDQDIDLIEKRAEECGDQLCSLQSAEELTTYLKYCMFNLKACAMIPFDKIKEGYWPVAELNVLYSQQLLSLDNAIKYTIGDLVEGKLAVEILEKINGTIGCSFSNDYDCDYLDNTDDNCPNTYNPQQRDTDKDGIGDVCDDDIDNDGIKNPLGIVDDSGNIIIRLWTPATDNCLFVVNKDQSDNNSNLIGDVCQSSAQRLSLTIAIDKIEGTLPKTVFFSALSKGNVSEYSWDFGDGSVANGARVSHSYALPGTYIVRLSAKGVTNTAQAITTVIVGRNPEEKQGLSLLTTPLMSKVGGEGSFSLSAVGNHDSYQWAIGKTLITTDKPFLKRKFSVPGSYPISIKALRNGKIVAASMFSFGVGDTAYGSMLSVSSLLPEKYQEVIFETKLSNISSSRISRIIRDFGDGKQIETKQMSLKYSYQSVGKKVVLQTIFLDDGTKLQNMVTLFVNAANIFSSYVLQFIPSPLDLTALDSLSFSTSLLGGSFSTLIFANTLAGDGINTVFPNNERIKFPLQAQHSYQNPGLYYPQTHISLDQCYQLSAQATLAVGGSDFCLQAKINNTLSSYPCDMDTDKIPDICDDDIDGDGIKNLLGVINPNTPNSCNYLGSLARLPSISNFDTFPVVVDILKQHFSYTCSLDNAPFTSNSDQIDTNRNGIGDSMEGSINADILEGFSPSLDIDKDGIKDNDDLCPAIPETWNTISDYDGCPELGMEAYCDNTSFAKGPTDFNFGEILTPPELIAYCGNNQRNMGETCLNCPEDLANCPLSCGNGRIDPDETCLNCPEDVGSCSIICGNNIVEFGETCVTCPQDVGTCLQYCGNGKQDFGETCKTCPQDIGSCGPSCGNGKIDAGETCTSCPEDAGICSSLCGNKKIDLGETCTNCPADLGVCPPLCGNGKIDPGETCSNCYKDIGNCSIVCGNKRIDFGETCTNCPEDLGYCPNACGNARRDLGETCANCPQDIGSCPNPCGNSKIDAGETCANCPEDLGKCIPTTCGNARRDLGETCKTCPQDIGSCPTTCGNGKIDTGETCTNCPEDLGYCPNACGNARRDLGETCANCPQDIGSCPNPCGNSKIDAGETCANCPEDLGYCPSVCGNDKIEAGETCKTCPQDVGICTIICGNGRVDIGETCLNCPKDIPSCLPSCGNGKIETGEICTNCPWDVGPCTLVCGNGIAEPGETCFNCPKDVPNCSTSCGNGKIEANENCMSCPQDVGSCTAICGNGTLEKGETCLNCSKDIRSCSGSCGNGIFESSLGEECDNGANNGKDLTCSLVCTRIESPVQPKTCGNGIIDVGEFCSTCAEDLGSLCVTQCGNSVRETSEQCDNGANNGKDGVCSLWCTSIDPSQPDSCGNGLWNLGETCVNCSQDLSDICITKCGNGVRELTEQCDNGANNGKDGKCSLSCMLVGPNTPLSCGNDIFDLGETCVNCSQDLSDICITKCGNGVKELTEQCDNGANNGKDGKCSLTCIIVDPNKPTSCGNGIIDLGETCVNCPEDLTDNLCATQCGNGIKESSEQCDNGLNNGKDRKCSTICTLVNPISPLSCGNGILDSGESCLTCPEDLPSPDICITRCGNGIIDTALGEECDNGTNNDKDGKCSLTCKRIDPSQPKTCGNGVLDPGETCTNCPKDIKDSSICMTQCGNSIIESQLGEQCDNGAANGSDGICTNLCMSVSSISGPDQSILCGNGKIDPAETCVNCPEDVGDCLFIITPPCMQCPCPFADIDSSLTTDDIIQAVLWDKTKTYPWRYSLGVKISY